MRTESEADLKEIELRLLRSQAQASERNLAGVLVLLLLLFIAPLLAATYWMQVQAERELTRGELERNLVQARTLAALVEREFVSAQQLLSSIADRDLFRRAWHERDLRALKRNLQEARELEPTFLFVSVYEPNGTLRAILPPDPILGQNFAYRDWYRGVTARWQPYVSGAYRTAAGSNPLVVAVAVPIRDDQGKPNGIMMAAYALNQLSHRFKDLETGAPGVSCVVDERGVVVASTGVDALGERLQGPEQDAVTGALAGQEGIGRFGTGAKESLIGYAPVPKLGWAVVYRRTAKEALEAATGLRWRNQSISFYLVLVYLATIALAGLLARRQGQLLAANQTLNEALEETEKRTRLIVATAQEAFVAMDAKGLIIDWNVQAEKTFGWPRSQALGRTLADTIVPPQHREAHRRGLQHFLATGEGPVLNRRVEITALHRDGHEFPVELTISPLRIVDTFVFNSFVHDITSRKRAEEALAQRAQELARSEEALRRQTKILQSVLESMGDGVVVADENGKFLLFNPAAERIIGIGPTDATPDQWSERYGCYLADTVTPYPPNELPLARAIRGESVDSAEVFLGHPKLPEGTLVSVTGRPLRGEGGVARGGVVVFRDISVQKRAEQALVRAKEEAERTSRFKDQFLSTMSHELRTPLNAVLGFSELLDDQRYGPLNDRQRRYISHIRNGGQHLLKLINDILDLSKIEAGRMHLAIEDVPVKQTMGEVLSGLRPLADKKSQALSEQTEASLAVRADALRFKQMLLNLVGNAIKFTPERGRIEVAAFRQDGQVRVEVRDTGPGIAPQEQKRIFEAFYRLRKFGETTEGTGLGLAITQRLVELHGGRLGLESEPGSGSCFYFTLPAAQPVRKRRPRETGKGRKASQAPRILVVEDDPAAAQLIQSQLTSSGYEAALCLQPEHAIEEAAKLQPNAITLDVLMQPTNGWEVLSQLKGDPRTARIPVILITIVDQPVIGVLLGADEYLVKPVDKGSLLAAVERCLDSRGGTAPVRPILVVEDDAGTREVLKELLTAQGYAVASTADGAQAHDWVSENLPELVILDLILPKKSGFELLAEWRASPRTADLPVFVLTGKELTREEEQYLRAHAESLLHKGQPWQEALVMRLQRIVDHPQPEQT